MSDLAGLANGADLTGVLPEGFDAGGATSLSALQFTIDTRQRELVSIGFRLACQKSWRIIDRVAVDDIFLDLEVTDPTDSENREITCKVGGKLQLGSQAVMSAVAEFPSFDVTGSLVRGPVNLTSAVGLDFPRQFHAAGRNARFPALGTRHDGASADNGRWNSTRRQPRPLTGPSSPTGLLSRR